MIKIRVQIPNSIFQMKTKLRQAVRQTVREETPKLSQEIISRTRRGQNVQGGSFRSYSESYKKQRQRMGLQTSPVNLTVTGEMLDLQEKIVERSDEVVATISVPILTEEYAKRHNKGLRGMPKRNFMGLSKQQVNKFKERLLRNVYKALK